MQGKRHDYIENTIPKPGEYGKLYNGDWYGVAPMPPDDYGFVVMANLTKHTVTEHEDGTITVSPSILIGPKPDGRGWHGYLERGIWREV